MMKAVIFALLATSAAAAGCADSDNWNANPADPKAEDGVCLSNDGGVTYHFHCPWESVGLVSGFGCTAVKYNCDAHSEKVVLYYETFQPFVPNGPLPKEWGPVKMKYTHDCIKHQCDNAADPGPKPA